MLRFSLTDSLLLNIFLPGAIWLIGIGWFAFPWIWLSIAPSISNAPPSSGTHFSETGILIAGFLAVVAFLTFFLAMFLGELLAVIAGYIEGYGLDRWQAREIGLPEYEKQWERYLDSLEKAHNSYVSKQVNAFHFQARSGLALLFLALLVLASPTKPHLAWVPAVLAAGLFKAAFDDHRSLAEFRRRRFAIKPDPTARPEELLGALVNAWCTRVAMKPLQLVLSVLSEDGKAIISDTTTARDVVLKMAALSDSEVLPAEKCMLCLVIAALSERVTPKAAG